MSIMKLNVILGFGVLFPVLVLSLTAIYMFTTAWLYADKDMKWLLSRRLIPYERFGYILDEKEFPFGLKVVHVTNVNPESLKDGDTIHTWIFVEILGDPYMISK